MRLTRLRESIEGKGIHGFLITNLINVRYLSGFAGSSGFILIAKDKNIFVTDFRYKEAAERELEGGRGTGRKKSIGHGWDIIIEKGDRLRVIKHLITDLRIRSLGFESSLAYDFFKGLSRCGARLRPFHGIVEKLRAIKDREEIRLVKESITRAEAAFLDVKPYLRPGRREREIALLLEEELKKRGCNRLPFDIIVSSGIRSAMPHAQAGDKRLSPGDLVVIDWGGEAGGYCSDMTRTFLIKGTGPQKGRKILRETEADIPKKIEIYRSVLEANRKAASSVVPGIGSRAIDNAARDSIKNAGYGKFFGHGTGHGVGLEVHELPRITWTKNEIIKENMVFTIEPGIYVEGLGGVRIEDMVLVKPGGVEVLTKLPRKLEII